MDYIIETIGSVFIGIAYFVSNKSIIQEYILGTCCILIYAVPIPISYLINESRVKDTIISKGWLEGFKSIFYSEEKIRHIRRQNFINEFVSISTQSRYHGQQTSFAREKELCFQRRLVANLQMLEIENQSFMIESNDSIEDKKGNAYDCVIEDIESCSLPELVGDISSVSENSVRIATDLGCEGNSDQMQSTIDCLLKKSSFKTFSRSYILKRLIAALHSGNNFRFIYFKYLESLNDFEKCVEEEEIKGMRRFDTIMSLVNAFKLCDLKGEILTTDKSEKVKLPIPDLRYESDTTDEVNHTEMTNILHLLKDSINIDHSFKHYLNILNKKGCDTSYISKEIIIC